MYTHTGQCIHILDNVYTYWTIKLDDGLSVITLMFCDVSLFIVCKTAMPFMCRYMTIIHGLITDISHY